MPNFLVANLRNSALLRAYRTSNFGILDGLKSSKLNQNLLTNLDNQQMENI